MFVKLFVALSKLLTKPVYESVLDALYLLLQSLKFLYKEFILIKRWLSKKTPQKASNTGNKNTAPVSTPKEKAKPQKAKSAKKQPRWDVNQFQVAPAAGKTRFHDLMLHDDLMHAIYDLGFDYCTPIQAMSLPHTLKGLDAIGKAQTGTGKTAAFLLAIIDQLLSNPIDAKERYPDEPRALIIAPTRELVAQIAADAKGLVKHSNLHIVSLVGGEPHEKQRKALDKQAVDILVATPGRLIDFVKRREVFLDQVETLVLDEADRMLDMGFIPQVKQIVRATPAKEGRQTLLFSATFTDDILNLCNQWTLKPLEVEIEPESVATETVEQKAYMVSDSEKFELLLAMIDNEQLGQTIIFTNRRDQVQRLYDRLKRAAVKVAQLSGDVAQNKRTSTLKKFKEGHIQFLIATDVVGRGIHIDGIKHVINFNLPQEPENYVHRIGRTGRAGAEGTAISFIGEEDAYELSALEALLGKKLPMELPPEYS